MTPTFVPLRRDTIAKAHEWIRRLYSHGDIIDYEEGRSTAALEGLLDNPGRGGFWFLNADELTLGYLVVLEEYSLEFGGRFALIDELYLDEGWRGQGLGKQAIAFAELWCRSRGIETIRLEVGPGNTHAIGLYRRLGFRVEERYLMTRQL